MLTRYHKIVSAVIAIGLVVVVQAFASPFPIFRYLIPATVLFVGVAQVYNYFYLQQAGSWNVWKLVRVGLFFVSWFGVFALLPNFVARGVFLLASIPIIYLVELLIGNFGEQVLINEVLLIVFGLFASALGMQYYYQLAESYVFILEFVAISLLLRASFEFIPYPGRLKMVSAIALALFILQLHWALSFLPFHYSALALILFSIFYAMWTLYYHSLFSILTRRRIQFYVLFALIAVAVITLVTPWTIIA